MGNFTSIESDLLKTAENDEKNTEGEKGLIENNKDKINSPANDKKKRPNRKKKVAEEPEILILSSDDENDDNEANVNEQSQGPSAHPKEPVYTDSIINAADSGVTIKVEELMQNTDLGLYTTLQCRSVNIGSYRVQPRQRVLISNNGIKLVIVHPTKHAEAVTVVIPIGDVMKALIHFGKIVPVIFIYLYPHGAARVRQALGMTKNQGPYYDPTSQDETQKRLTLLPDKLSEDNKTALNNILVAKNLLSELTDKDANELLVRSSSLDWQNVGPKAVYDSNRIQKIMVFPPPPDKGGIALNNQDYACLGEDQFLNDVIIDFYLKYLMLKVLSPEDRNRTHVFSTFFYKRLTTKPKNLRKCDPENDAKLSAEEKRHTRVKGWTKQVNLFEKDFIIIPINEHSHWFLAIICFPGLKNPVRFSDGTPVEVKPIASRAKKGSTNSTPAKTTVIGLKSEKSVQIGSTTITHLVKQESLVNVENDSGSDRDEADGDEADLHPSSDEEESEQTEDEQPAVPAMQIPLLSPPSVTPQKEKPKPRGRAPKDPIKQPCILIFDSLAGASRVRVVATLRDYLKIEYKRKMGGERLFNKDTMKGAVPKVPQQNNFTDCGLYVLQYVESFFQTPIDDFNLPMRKLKEWFAEDLVARKRQEIAQLIISLMEGQGIDVDKVGLPQLTFNSDSSMLHMDEEEDEEAEEEMEEEEEEEGEEDEAVDEEDEDDEELEHEELRKQELGDLSDMDLCEDDESIAQDELRESLITTQNNEQVSAIIVNSGKRQVGLVDYESDLDSEVPRDELEDVESQIACTAINKSQSPYPEKKSLDIIKKLVHEKHITVSRGADKLDVDSRRTTTKRTVTASGANLKSVRIQRRTESKRPKLEER